MAYTARMGRAVLELSIDGGAFVRGAADAKATMRDLARGIAQTQRDISKQAFTLSGRDQIAEASKLATAVERVGGASRLTASEKAKVNAQLKEAIAKYEVLGKQAPAAMIATERATRGAGTATQWMHGRMVALGSFVGTFAANIASRAVSSLVAMGREAFTSAGRIIDLSNKTGLGTRTIQQMQFVAEQTGGTLDGFTNAAFQMGVRIEEGGRQVSEAVDSLSKYGLEVERLKTARPDEQWNMVTTALSKVENVQERNRLGMALMGRTFRDVAASIQEGYNGIADQAAIATDAQLKELERLNDEWQKFLRNLTTGFGAAMGNAVVVAREARQMSAAELAKAWALGALVGDPMGGVAARARVNDEAARRKDIRLVAPVEAPITDFVEELKAAQAELKHLDAAERAQIAAARKLGDVTDEELTESLVRFGVSAARAGTVLKLLSGELKTTTKDGNDAAKEWAQLIGRFSGGEQRLNALNLAKALSSGQLELSRMTKEAQEAIEKALEEGAEAWRAWGGTVPAEVDKAIAAVNKLKTSKLTIINDLQPNLTQEPSIDDVGAQLEELERPAKLQEEAARDHGKVMRDLELQRHEFAIRQAERAGAKRADILRMESMLEQRRRDAQLAEADEAFQRDVAQLQKTSSTYDAEYAKREQEYQDHVHKITETWEQGEIERREMIRRESSFWASELGKRIAGELRGIQHELTGRLVSTLFAGGDDEAKRRAKAAREDYERLAASGRASAEEITRAFRTMREAEEAAQSKFADRFKSIWDAIKRHLFNIFDSILEAFINNLLKGMLNAIMKSNLGQKLLGWIPGLGGGGGRGVIQDVVGGALGQVLGIGGGVATTAFSTAAGGTLAASMIAPSVASAAVPAAIASQGASAAVYGAAAGSTAAGAGGATAAGAGAAGGGGLTAGLAAAGPWAALAAPLVTAWLSGYWEPSDGQRILEARRLIQGGLPASKLPDWITDDASTMKRIREGRLFDPVDFGVFGRNVRLGEGFTPAPLATPALEAAMAMPVYNSRQELGAATLSRLQGIGGAQPAVPQHTTVHINVETVDAEGFDRVWNDKIRPRLMFDLSTDRAGLASSVRKQTIDKLPRRSIVKSATDSATGARFQFVDR